MHVQPIVLSDAETLLLTDMLDNWQEGIEEAKKLTTVDPTVQTADELTDLMSGYEDDLVILQHLRRKVTKCALDVRLIRILLLSACIYTAKRLIDSCSSSRKARS